jgi:hypothetical protein
MFERLDLEKFDATDVSFRLWREWNDRSNPPLNGRFGLPPFGCYSSGLPRQPPTVTQPTP